MVSHRKIILPQLGAPGVAAHQIKQFTGFKVHYGPVRAADLPAYLDAGLKATKEMRIMTFPLKERAVLIPIELDGNGKTFFHSVGCSSDSGGPSGTGQVLQPV